MLREPPLGKASEYPDEYSPALLHPIARDDSRIALWLSGELPFRGEDIWNAWDLTWLAENGRPMVASAEIRVPADSNNLIESKSLKLYLNSFSMSRFDSADAVTRTLATDLSSAAGSDVEVQLGVPNDMPGNIFAVIDGDCIDDDAVDCSAYEVDASLLRSETSTAVNETLYTHGLRSLCPVTGQPDLGSVIVTYTGPGIDRASLLRYIVSYRQHKDFHEACVERIFVDIHNACSPGTLAVYARFQRRGGIDINPYRSSDASTAENLRLWRQ